jgi:tetratricopeptide (TPR) repeat protein
MGIMVILALIGIAIAWVYYGNINKAVDPRVRQAQVMYGRYNVYASENDYEKVLSLLDSIKEVYSSVPHYANSYELGVIQNNRASVFLTKALSDTTLDEIRQNYFALAEQHLLKSIDYYNGWMNDFGNLTEEEIHLYVDKEFRSDPVLLSHKNIDAMITKRVKDVLTAQIETPRRLSVSYSNLGIIKRHEDKVDEAVEYYTKALELWDENHAAKNNLNILFGKPIEKQGLLRKLFPPERN